MAITVDLSPAIEKELQKLASRQGVPLEQYVSSLILRSVDCGAALDEVRRPIRDGFAAAERDAPSSQPDTLSRFACLSDTWQHETRHLSSIEQIAMHPSYQEIIGMGMAVVPLLLNELEQRPNHWFWALAAITGARPVKPESRGVLSSMAADWLEWGRKHGLTS